MGKLFRGIDDMMRGRLGNHVGRYVKGENIIAMRPVPSNKPATDLQLSQRGRFGFLNSWLAELGPVIDLGFKDYDAEMSPRNACMSYNWKEGVVIGVAPNLAINYAKMCLSNGSLVKPGMPEVATGTGSSLEFTWQEPFGRTNAKETDKMSFVVYDPLSEEYALTLNVVDRSVLEYEMLLPAEFSGHSVHVWIVVMSADKKLVSDSVHLGPVGVG